MPKFTAGTTSTGYFEIDDKAYQKLNYDCEWNDDNETLGVYRTGGRKASTFLVVPTHYSDWTDSGDSAFTSYDSLKSAFKAAGAFFFISGASSGGNDYGDTTLTIEYFQEVDATSATTGTISYPTGASLNETILANVDNSYAVALDTDGDPNFETPKDENNAYVYPTLASDGTWSLPSNTTVEDTFAIVFYVDVSLENYNSWTTTQLSFVYGDILVDEATQIQYDNFGQNITATDTQGAIEQKASYQVDGTRIISGASFSVNGDDNTQWDLATGTAQILDFSSDRGAPTTKYLEWGAQTGLTTTSIATADKTAIAITDDNTARTGIVFTNSFDGLVNGETTTLYIAEKTDDNAIFSVYERNIYAYLGRLTHFSQTSLFSPNVLPDSGYSVKSKLAALARAVMPYNDSGNTLSGNTTDTTRADISAGTICSENVSAVSDPNNPDFIDHAQQSQISLLSRYYDASIGGREDGSTITAWDFSTWNDTTDSATPLKTAGNNNYLVPRIYRFPQTGNIIYQYPQKVYSTSDTARLGIFNDSIIEDTDLNENAVWIGSVIQKTNGSDTTDIDDWEFVPITSQFSGGSSSSAGLVTQQDAYDATIDKGEVPTIGLQDVSDGGYSIQEPETTDNIGNLFEVLDSDDNGLLEVESTNGITIGESYTLPLTGAVSGQVLTYPSSGSVLEWTSYSEDNVYTEDGSLTGNRNFDLANYNLLFYDNTTATAASGTLTFSAVPSSGTIITINGIANHLVNSLDEFANYNQVDINGLLTGAEVAALFSGFLNASTGVTLTHIKVNELPVSGSDSSNVVTATATTAGSSGNSITTVSDSADAVWSGSTLSGGVDADEDLLEITGSGLVVGGSYTLPLTAGTSGQVLAYPSTGSTLEWVDDDAGTSIYTSDGTLDISSGSTRTLIGESGDGLEFQLYNGTSSTYTLRSSFEADSSGISLNYGLGNGSGADSGTFSLELNNTGFEYSGSDVQFVGDATNDFNIGSSTNSLRFDSVNIYSDSLLNYDCGSLGTDRFFTTALYALDLMQIGYYNDSSNQLTGFQVEPDNLQIQLQNNTYFDLTTTNIVVGEDLDIDSGYGLAFLDSSSNRQVGFGYDETINDAFFFYLNETDTRFSDVSAIASGGIGFYDTALDSSPFFTIASDEVNFNGVDIVTEVDTNWFLTGDDLKLYDGASDTSNNIVTFHGDGDHSSFDPFITLHEGFATGNGTNSQSLIMNIGKAARLQYNDGTRSVDLFHTEAVVNAAETVTHMETSFQSVQHKYIEIDNFEWYFDTSGGTNTWTWYDDDAGTNEILSFDDSGNLTVLGTISGGSYIGTEYYDHIWGEESTTLNTGTDGGYQFSFGNGETGQYGGIVVYVPSGYTCEWVGMTMACKDAWDATITAVVNGVDQTQTISGNITTAPYTTTTTFGTAITINNGDKVTFRTTSVTVAGEGGTPCAALKFTKTS